MNSEDVYKFRLFGSLDLPKTTCLIIYLVHPKLKFCHHLFEMEIFYNIINVFTVTFDQFNA